MKIVVIADMHGDTDNLSMPEADMLIVAGDFSANGTLYDIFKFNTWLGSLNYKWKIVIAGNHELICESFQYVMICNYIPNGIYLQDSSVTIEGIKFYGSPWQPKFNNWAFNLPRDSKLLQKKWDILHEDTDILITHSPPYGILDKKSDDGESLGCKFLRNKVDSIRPTYHVFGHVHGGYGSQDTEFTTFVNASLLNEAYELINKPSVIEI